MDRETFISDNRFISIIKKEKIYNLITLVIYEVQIQDQGNYECEVSSQPTILRIIELIVLEPEVSILGDPDIYVKEGSEVSLKCIIKNIVGDIPFVTWLFNDQES